MTKNRHQSEDYEEEEDLFSRLTDAGLETKSGSFEEEITIEPPKYDPVKKIAAILERGAQTGNKTKNRRGPVNNILMSYLPRTVNIAQIEALADGGDTSTHDLAGIILSVETLKTQGLSVSMNGTRNTDEYLKKVGETFAAQLRMMT